MGEKLRNVVATAAFATGTVGNVVLVEWRRQPTKVGVQSVGQVIRILLAEQPTKIGLLVVTRLDTPAPDAEARDAFARSMKDNSSRIYGSSMAIEGSGLRAAASRAVLTAITLLGDVSPVPKVCSSVDEAATVLSHLSDEANGPGFASVSDVVAAFADLRRQDASQIPA